MAPSRGVLYLKWGTKADKVFERSLASLRKFHPELAVHVHALPDDSSFLHKSGMMSFTPFDETLYLDADTVVLDRLDFGFEKATRHGLACAICECPLARRYKGLKGDLVEFNTGVLFFTLKAEAVFQDWARLVRSVDSSIEYRQGNQVYRAPVNDQAAFAAAIDQSGFLPYVLPLNWNFRPRWHKSFWGPIKIWHEYAEVPAILQQWNAEQTAPGASVMYFEQGPPPR